METTFRFNGKIITTPNLEKKLKKMKIQLSDIEIIENSIKEEEVEDVLKRKVIVCSNIDEIRRVCYIPIDYRPTIRELFKNHIWNPETKTGIKEITEDYLMTMYYVD